MKHLEVRQQYSAGRRIFNSLLGVLSGDETLHLIAWCKCFLNEKIQLDKRATDTLLLLVFQKKKT